MSRVEDMFQHHIEYYCMLYKIGMAEREYKFNVSRKWRFDFAFPDKKIAVEIEGGTWKQGRHTRGAGFEKDCEKYNQAVLDGWRVLRFTSGMVYSGKAIETILKILEVE
jgi:very-short-patch-repair endonuclease